MKKMTSFCLLALMTLPVAARGAVTVSVTSEIMVKSTLHDFTVKAVSDTVDVKENEKRLEVAFRIAGMETGNKDRDIDMMRMFRYDDFPFVTGTTNIKAILALDPSAGTAELPVDIAMHGVFKPVIGKVSNITKTDSEIVFDLTFPIILNDYKLKPPSVMMIIRVAKVVQVTSRVTVFRSK